MGWIRAKVKLPEMGRDGVASRHVLVTDGKTISKGFLWLGGKWGICSECSDVSESEVTYWMELSKLPFVKGK